jgi:hypothetical protein
MNGTPRALVAGQAIVIVDAHALSVADTQVRSLNS